MVVPFNTHAGYGAGSSFSDFKARCTGCRVAEGFSTRGGIERDGVLFVMEGSRANEVVAWLRKIAVLHR